MSCELLQSTATYFGERTSARILTRMELDVQSCFIVRNVKSRLWLSRLKSSAMWRTFIFKTLIHT